MNQWPNQRLRIPLQNAPNHTQKTSPLVEGEEEKSQICSNCEEVGIGLIGFGIFFTLLGIVLFFDRGLLALGNIIYLSGLAVILGWRSTVQLFTNRMNYKGSLSFLVGLFLIFVRWPIAGIVFEIYGSIVLFRLSISFGRLSLTCQYPMAAVSCAFRMPMY
ncbi:vesicle transport protein GOT1 isoform X1 [Cinnamomum micranthum f. kanehirae]|uniref:Vesicle transport protein GOT1 isoform X1 n=1 Tax=Cinnamomum micranthum f. kanehirae TaxID=337451 RepID=A0A3S3NNE2_9MAGN|nr:vesicle transport protein GOT1 isoform X1 [Cinnamomum micranthum f. kanehirae]